MTLSFFKKSDDFEVHGNGRLREYLERARTKITELELKGERSKADRYRVEIACKLAKACIKKGCHDSLSLTMAQWILNELPRIKLDGYERYEYEGGRNEDEQEIIALEIPDIRIEDVKGRIYRNIAKELETFLRITKTELGKRPEAETEGKVLLYGPQGTGKTHIALAVANELGIPALYIVTSLIWQKYVGESEKALMRAFQRAMDEGGMIILDEFESLALNREQSSERVALSVTSLLLQLLICEKPIVITITNMPWLIDRAVLDRFDELVYVPPPDAEARIALFRYYLFEKYDVAGFSESDLQYLADLTRPREINGKLYYHTARTIKKIIKKASFIAEKRYYDNRVRLDDIKIAINSIRLTLNEDMLKKYEEFEQNMF